MPCCRIGCRLMPAGWELVFDFFEVRFCRTAERAYPVFGDVFEGCSGGDTSVGISDFRIVFITAQSANPFAHGSFSFPADVLPLLMDQFYHSESISLNRIDQFCDSG